MCWTWLDMVGRGLESFGHTSKYSVRKKEHLLNFVHPEVEGPAVDCDSKHKLAQFNAKPKESDFAGCSQIIPYQGWIQGGGRGGGGGGGGGPGAPPNPENQFENGAKFLCLITVTTKYGIRNGIRNGIWNGYGMMSRAQ